MCRVQATTEAMTREASCVRRADSGGVYQRGGGVVPDDANGGRREVNTRPSSSVRVGEGRTEMQSIQVLG